MEQRTFLFLLVIALMFSGCYLRRSYTLDEYRTKSEPIRITSVTKTNGEKVFFARDEGQYDPTLNRVHGPVMDDSEATIPSQDIGLVNIVRPNPMIPVFEGMLIGACIVV